MLIWNGRARGGRGGGRMSEPVSAEDKVQRQEGMTKALDRWIMKYCEKELSYKIPDAKHIGWDNIVAVQEPGEVVWRLEVKGSVAGGGPSFEGEFSLKQDVDKEWMVRKEKFARSGKEE
eukprot:Hpha_TRINITY_DN15363_c0_g4::TRINITY_DN15363_c0_g4_i1::g.88271::m.88271